MTIVINDPTLLSQLLIAENHTVLTTPDGKFTGNLVRDSLIRVKSPFSDEEMVEYRKQRDGRKLADIIRDLESGATP